MARKAQEILKARGYSDVEISSLDPRFLAVIEAEDVARDQVIAENQRLQETVQNTNKWYEEEANPTLARYQGEVVNSRAEIARLKAQLTAEQELGMRRVAVGNGGAAAGAEGAAGGAGNGGANGAGGAGRQATTTNPDLSQLESRFVSTDVFRQAFDQTGDAIAIMNDISEDYRDLYGKRMPGGAAGLRAEYRKATQNGGFRGDIRAFAEQHFKMNERRTELETKQSEKHEADIAQRAVSNYIEQHGLAGNPMLRMPSASRSPFVAKPVQGGAVDGKNPWDRGTVEQRRSERVQKHGTKFLQGQMASA